MEKMMPRRKRTSEIAADPLVLSHETVEEGMRQAIETMITAPLSRTISRTKYG